VERRWCSPRGRVCSFLEYSKLQIISKFLRVFCPLLTFFNHRNRRVVFPLAFLVLMTASSPSENEGFPILQLALALVFRQHDSLPLRSHHKGLPDAPLLPPPHGAGVAKCLFRFTISGAFASPLFAFVRKFSDLVFLVLALFVDLPFFSSLSLPSVALSHLPISGLLIFPGGMWPPNHSANPFSPCSRHIALRVPRALQVLAFFYFLCTIGPLLCRKGFTPYQQRSSHPAALNPEHYRHFSVVLLE